MKYTIQIHFDNKGHYAFVKDFEDKLDLMDLLCEWSDGRSTLVIMDEESAKPVLINMNTVSAILTAPFEEEICEQNTPSSTNMQLP